MNDPTDRPLFEDLRAEVAALGAELREMAAARWELAKLEMSSDLRSLRRLAIWWLAACAIALAVLPVMVVAAASALAPVSRIGLIGWLLILAAGMLLVAIAAVWLAWRRFRRNFLGLRETVEELREDAVWLNERRGPTSDGEK